VARDGRLAQVERLGRPGEVAEIGDGDEGAKLVEIHEFLPAESFYEAICRIATNDPWQACLGNYYTMSLGGKGRLPYETFDYEDLMPEGLLPEDDPRRKDPVFMDNLVSTQDMILKKLEKKTMDMKNDLRYGLYDDFTEECDNLETNYKNLKNTYDQTYSYTEALKKKLADEAAAKAQEAKDLQDESRRLADEILSTLSAPGYGAAGVPDAEVTAKQQKITVYDAKIKDLVTKPAAAPRPAYLKDHTSADTSELPASVSDDADSFSGQGHGDGGFSSGGGAG
jgi:hypothetical protein